MDPEQTASMIKSSMKYIWLYIDDIKRRRHFQDKTISGVIVKKCVEIHVV